MSSVSDAVDLLGLDPATWKPQALHAADRTWIETNCYIDVWAELLPALGHPAEAALAFTVRQDFEGDHFTFFKFPLEDLEKLFDLSAQELAIYDTVEAQTLAQLKRGRPVLIEVDAFWLPDVAGHHKEHVKTTVAAIALDPVARRFGYFHNTGYHIASGEDFDGLFRKPVTPDTLFPYVEFVKRGGGALQGKALLATSLALLRLHLHHRPKANPVTAWREALPAHLEHLATRDMAFFHLYAFNLPRQLGANFEMLATYVEWLASNGESGLAEVAAAGRRIAEAAKAIQFQLARMVNRRKFDSTALQLGPIEADYETILGTLAKRYG